MKAQNIVISGICLALFACLFARSAYAMTEVTDCSTLDIEGESYYMTGDIIKTPVDMCVNIAANNVSLDCRGYDIIRATGFRSGTGILVYDFVNATIFNCSIKNWETGIELFKEAIPSYNNLYNLTMSDNAQGILICPSSYNNIYDLTISNNEKGIFDTGLSSYNDIYSLTMFDNNIGIYYSGSFYNNLHNLTMFDNNIGIYFEEARFDGIFTEGNNLFNNFLDNDVNMFFCDINEALECSGDFSLNYFNNTDNGNLWTNSTNNGYSDTCVDVDYDGFCDEPYDIMTDSACSPGVDCYVNATDYIPLSGQTEPPTTTTLPSLNGTTYDYSCAGNYSVETLNASGNVSQTNIFCTFGCSESNSVNYVTGRVPQGDLCNSDPLWQELIAFICVLVLIGVVWYLISKRR